MFSSVGVITYGEGNFRMFSLLQSAQDSLYTVRCSSSHNLPVPCVQLVETCECCPKKKRKQKKKVIFFDVGSDM